MTRGAELLFAAALVFLTWPVWADFDNETLVSTEGETASAPDLYIDMSDNAFVTWAENGEVYFAVGPHFDVGATAITDDDVDQSSPVVHVSNTGTITFVYEESDSGAEREIISRQSVLGTFQEAEPLTDSDDDDQSPDIALQTNTELHVGWVVDNADTLEIWVSDDLDDGDMITEGHDPQLVKDSDDVVHLVYLRDGNLYYRVDEGDGFGDETQITDDDADDSDPSIVVSSTGVPAVAFERAGDVFYCEGDGAGGFNDEVNVTDNDATCTEPRLVRHPDGGVSQLVFLQDGDIWHSTIVSSIFITSAVNVTDSDGDESVVVAAVDGFGFVHLAYLRDDELYYTNNAPVPEPSVEVSVASGGSPLLVEFTYTGTGPVNRYRWQFGDNDVSLNDSPTHTYESEGTYDVELTVSGPGGRVTETYPALIEVTPPENTFWIPSVVLYEGQDDAVIPVMGSHDEVVQGYQIAARFDGTVLEIEELLLTGTAVRKMFPEFLAQNIIDDGEDSYFTLGLIIDSLPPFDGRELEAADEQRLINLDINVLDDLDVPLETTIDLRQDISDPIVYNIYTVDGESRTPELTDAVIEVVAEDDLPGTLFIRGDADANGTVALLDVLTTLEYIFYSFEEPACLDAADSNDDGLLGIADAVRTLEYIFQNGKVISYPYPGYGMDETDDDELDCDG